jgi:predicted TIM-barrel fold metal-dependent hydrolase
MALENMKKWPSLSASVLIVVIIGWPGPALASSGCFDRATAPYTSVVDSHVHLRPFGGSGIPLDEMGDYWRRAGVHYVNIYGIGQILPTDSTCTYYLDCPGTPVLPSMKNDVENVHDVMQTRIDGVRMTLSMTFPDLANPAGIVDGMRQLDSEYPGQFSWMGEVNLIKQAILPNAAQPAALEDIAAWWPFMAELRRRDLPITIHSDLGNNAEPLKYLYLMEAVLALYPNNKIVWAHLGLSEQLTMIEPRLHIDTLRRLMDQYPKLYLDIAWRVLEDNCFCNEPTREQYVPFLNEYSARIIPGTDFVASRKKNFSVYQEELDVTSRINKFLSDNAFRDIALGQSYFGLLGLPNQAPPVCAT